MINVFITSGLWQYHTRLVRLVHFHSGQVEIFYSLVLGQVQMNKVHTTLYIVFHILINYYKFICYIENSVDLDECRTKAH